MLLNNPPRSTESNSAAVSGVASGAEGSIEPSAGLASAYSIAGKVFILGEYAVLGQLPAVIAAVGPRFRAQVGAVAPDPFQAPGFHPKSPVARLLDWASDLKAPQLELRFEDAFEGKGGFGGSTAEFALAYRALVALEGWDTGWERAWKLYRELTRSSSGSTGLPPSGADLVAQWEGGVILFEGGRSRIPHAENLWKRFDWGNFLVFSASGQEGRKVATHEHLATLSDPVAFAKLVSELRAPLMKGIGAIRENHQARLGQALGEYAEVLRAQGLELPATTGDRKALSSLPGVLGVKGAGALQADAVLVLMDEKMLMEEGNFHRERVIEGARARGLALVCDGISCEPGVSCHG